MYATLSSIQTIYMKTEEAIKHTTKILNNWLPTKILHDRMPGLSVGIIHNGKLVYKAGFGYADLEQEIKATSKTQYRIASISKTFTTIAILQLVEQGKINLDDPISKYLRWFKVESKTGDSKSITIRQVLTHSAGIFRDGTTPHWENDKFPSLKDFRKQWSEKSITFENLTKFKYSNFGFSILGQVIQAVSGTDYENYMKKNVISPLGMKNTEPDFIEDTKLLAKGYGRVIPNQDEREVFNHTATKSFAPATGFLSSVEDLAKFVSALSLKHKAKNPILGRELKKEMLREHWRTIEDEWYGFGVDVYKIENRKIVGHSGGFPGFITQISLDTENDIGVITLSNTLASSACPINTGIFRAIYHLIDNGDKYLKTKKAVGSLHAYTGTYRSRWEDSIIVPVGKRLLIFGARAHFPTKDVVVLEPKNKKEFVVKGDGVFSAAGETIKFTFNTKGKVTGLIWGATPSVKI